MSDWDVWLWDASDPGDWSGVAGDFDGARQAVEECITKGHAATATLQRAYLHSGGTWMRSGYRRWGTMWTAARDGDAITWEPPLAVSAELAS